MRRVNHATTAAASARRPAVALLACVVAVFGLVCILIQHVHLPSPGWPEMTTSAAAAAAGGGDGGGGGTCHVVVIGGGLAGLVAAHELSQIGGGVHVTLLEKEAQLGGNSAKASSGINAINAAAGDSEELFAGDTARSGGGLSSPELVARLVNGSGGAIEALEALGADLQAAVRLGGHSAPRTRFSAAPGGPNVGLMLVKAVSARVAAAHAVAVRTGCRVRSLERDADGLRLVVRFDCGGGGRHEALLADAVVLATGGFAASKELLLRHRPEVAELPTTNGVWATGDGLALGESLGAGLVQMEHVQVHPTGFVDPADPSAPTKWLAPEKLRGCGAVLLSRHDGRRFVDELGRRDEVTAAVNAQRGREAWLLLGPAGGRLFGEATLGFYAGKGMFTKCASLEDAARHMQVDAAALRAELTAYDALAAAANANASSSGGGGAGAVSNPAAAGAGGAAGAAAAQPAPAAAPAAAGVRDAFGKRFFPCPVLSAAAAAVPQGKEQQQQQQQEDKGPFWIARTTPVVHYTMGGLEIDERARVLAAADADDHHRPHGGGSGVLGRLGHLGGAGGGHGGNSRDNNGDAGRRQRRAVVAGLFAAGEVSGGLHGANRLGGNSLAECAVFGRVAAEHAAEHAKATAAAVAAAAQEQVAASVVAAL